MVIREDANWIEIEVVDCVSAKLPTPGDVEVSLAVSSGNFAGQGFAWIEAAALSSFVGQLRELETRRQGSAELERMSSGEFRLRIWSINRRGHMAIAGRIAKQIHKGEAGPYLHSVEFGFEFDPTLLPTLLAGFVAIGEGSVAGS